MHQFRWQVASGYGLVVAAIGVPAIAALFVAFRAGERRDQVATAYARDVALAERMSRDGIAIAAAVRAFALVGDPRYPQTIAQAREDFSASLVALRDRVRDPVEIMGLVRVTAAAAAYEIAVDKLMDMRAPERGPPDPELVATFNQVVDPPWRELDEALGDFVAMKHGQVQPAIDASTRAFHTTLLAVAAGLAAAIGLAAFFAMRTARALSALYARQKEASQVAISALAARDEMVGIVAHDLRSPLSAIALNAGRFVDDPDARMRAFATSVEKIALRMGHLITSMLDASSISDGRLELHRGLLRVEDAVQETLEMFAPHAETRQIALRWQGDSMLAVDADRERVIEVLANLVDNALKFTRPDGAIHVSAEARGGEVWIAVADTGSGIAAEHVPHIFERFWKATPGGKRGSGLGLFIVKGLVEAHGGRVWVNSEPGAGTTFTFTLPRVQDAAWTSEQRSPARQDARA